MAYSEEQHEEQKAIIRRIMAMNPTITLRVLRNRLMKADQPLELSLPYLMELTREVRTERVKAIEDETKEDIYAEMKDVVEYVNRSLREIALEEKIVSSNKNNSVESRVYGQNNRIKAMNSIVDNSIKLLNLKMDLGIVERKVGTMDINIISMMSALKRIRNGDFKTALPNLISAPTQSTG